MMTQEPSQGVRPLVDSQKSDAPESDMSEDDDDSEDDAKVDKKRKWFVLDPVKGPKKVASLLEEPVLSAITRQSEFEYAGYVCMLLFVIFK
jgi:hypothetical protein